MRKLLSIALVMIFGFSILAIAEERELEKETKELEKNYNKQQLRVQIKTKYEISEDKINEMSKNGYSYPNIIMACELSKQSGKSLDEITTMRTEQKMGWGKIAKELGLKPNILGQSIRQMRKDLNAEKGKGYKATHRLQKLARKEERRAERQQRKEEQRQMREERKQERQSRKGR